jgi:hypothetical protein
MRPRIIPAIVALATLVGATGSVVALTASPASAGYVGVVVIVDGFSPDELDYEDTTEYVAIDASIEALGVDIADFAEAGESEPDYKLAPVANVGTVTNSEVVNVAVVRISVLGQLPLLDEPATCHLDASGNGTCSSS